MSRTHPPHPNLNPHPSRAARCPALEQAGGPSPALDAGASVSRHAARHARRPMAERGTPSPRLHAKRNRGARYLGALAPRSRLTTSIRQTRAPGCESFVRRIITKRPQLRGGGCATATRVDPPTPRPPLAVAMNLGLSEWLGVVGHRRQKGSGATRPPPGGANGSPLRGPDGSTVPRRRCRMG